MKVTLDLPTSLLRGVKLHARKRKQKLGDAIAQLLEAGLSAPPGADTGSLSPKPMRLGKHGPLTIENIETAIDSGRE